MKILKINLHIKRVRAEVIRKHLHSIGTNKCVCFTCGNARKALEKAGLDVVGVGNNEKLKPNKWFSYSEIQNTFNRFDATSGHLPLPIMNKIATELQQYCFKNGWIDNKEEYLIPTGSGESIVLMNMAFPEVTFYPIREGTPETEFSKQAPLNRLVYALSGWDIKTQEEQGKIKWEVEYCMPRAIYEPK